MSEHSNSNDHTHLLLLPPNLIGLADLAGESSKRFALSGVLLEHLEGETYRATASNGQYLLQVTGEGEQPHQHPLSASLTANGTERRGGLIPAPEWRKAFRAAPKGKAAKRHAWVSHVLVRLRENESTLASTDLDSKSEATVRHLEGRFPDTERIFPTGEPQATVLVDARKLVKLLGVLVDLTSGEDAHAVTLELHGPRKPIVLRAQGGSQKSVALLMPLFPPEEEKKK